jgi:hypothetical protein
LKNSAAVRHQKREVLPVPEAGKNATGNVKFRKSELTGKFILLEESAINITT